MAHSHPYDKVWLWTAQTGFQRCSLLEIWVDTREAALVCAPSSTGGGYIGSQSSLHTICMPH